MEQEYENTKAVPTSEDRLWTALADQHQDMERRFESVSKRIERIERSGSGATEQLIDNRTIGMLIAITVIPIALQVIGALLARRAGVEE